MFGFLKRDPVERAKKHVEKALKEIEDDYYDYASDEYEKAARLFFEAGRNDFAVKYFREAAYCALAMENHNRAGEMKIIAAETVVGDAMFNEGGSLYAESSDHYHRTKRMKESINSLSMAIICYLAARNFDTAVNMIRKADKRLGKKKTTTPLYDLAKLGVSVLVEGESTSPDILEKTISKAKPKETNVGLFNFIGDSLKIAQETEVVIEWAGKVHEEVNAKTPIEFELRYKCPADVRVTEYKFSLSNSVVFEKEPGIDKTVRSKDGSWLMVIKPVLSGEGTVGPFRLTLDGDEVLVHKHSNKIDFRIARAPSNLVMHVTPKKLSCDLGEELVLDVTIKNEGDGPADNIRVGTELTDGLELSIGLPEKQIQFIGPGEKMVFQVYVKGIGFGEGTAKICLTDEKDGSEITESVSITVG